MPFGSRKRRVDPVRVVVADDQAEVRRALKRYLTRDATFVVVGEAADGEEAVRLVAELRPDAVIMDLAMPNMDGLQATTEISAASPTTKIIVLSSMVPFAGTKDDALALGAHAVFDKYTHPKKLIKGILGAIES